MISRPVKLSRADRIFYTVTIKCLCLIRNQILATHQLRKIYAGSKVGVLVCSATTTKEARVDSPVEQSTPFLKSESTVYVS